MAFTARLTNSDTTFEIKEGETVLDAALRQGVEMEYGCRHGRCSACKYFLEDGDVDFGEASVYSLSDEEREEGYGLMCCATPLTDLEIESKEIPDPRAKPHLIPDDRRARVSAVTQIADTLWRLTVELDEPLEFYAGQFVELQLHGRDEWRSYSIASDPAAGNELEFVIKYHDGGAFSGQLPTLSVGDEMTVRGPFGRSYLRDGEEDLLLVATGSGIAPLVSMVKVIAREKQSRGVALFYGARTMEDVPDTIEALRDLLSENERASVKVCLTQPPDIWNGNQGRVTLAIQSDVADASASSAYVCGSPEMCETVGTLLEAKGIPDGELRYDKFHSATSDA